MAVRLLLALILSVAVVLTAAALVASTSQARKMQWFTCGQNGVTLRTAPWTMGIQDTIGVRIKHGTTYFLRAGDPVPHAPLPATSSRISRNSGHERQSVQPRSEASTAMSRGDTTPTFSGCVHSAPGRAAGQPTNRHPQGATSSGS